VSILVRRPHLKSLCRSFEWGLTRYFTVSLIGAAFVALPLGASAVPYKPKSDAQELEYLPAAGNQNVRDQRRLHAELAARPTDLSLAVRVASQDIKLARSESDPRFNGYAEAALAPWLALAKPPNSVLVLRATLRQATHDFSAAREDLDRVILVEPRNGQARLTRATILQVEGLYSEALADCRSLALLAEELVTTTCVASVISLQGRGRFAEHALLDAIERAPHHRNTEIYLWALTLLAEIEARLGDSSPAEAHFRQALSLGVRDVYLLAAYSDFLLDSRRFSEVETLLRGELRTDPLLLRLSLAEAGLRSSVLSGHVADLADRFAKSRLRGDTSHQREEARFTLNLLNKAEEALRFARANWAVQREPADTRLLLEAALAAGAPAAAKPALDWLGTTQLEDGQIGRLVRRFDEISR
jgi:tetratricopeptide (TPR) repeat protein